MLITVGFGSVEITDSNFEEVVVINFREIGNNFNLVVIEVQFFNEGRI